MKSCPKCGGWETKASYAPMFYRVPAVFYGNDCSTFELPRAIQVCHYSVCPDSEHIHCQCACGYRWTDAVKGQELGQPVPAPPMSPPPPPANINMNEHLLLYRVWRWWKGAKR